MLTSISILRATPSGVAWKNLTGDRLRCCLRKPLADWGGESDSEHSFNDSNGVVTYLVIGKGSGAYGTFDLADTAVCVIERPALGASIRASPLFRLHRILT